MIMIYLSDKRSIEAMLCNLVSCCNNEILRIQQEVRFYLDDELMITESIYYRAQYSIPQNLIVYLVFDSDIRILTMKVRHV